MQKLSNNSITSYIDLLRTIPYVTEHIAETYPKLKEPEELFDTLCHEACHNIAALSCGGQPGNVSVHVSAKGMGGRAQLGSVSLIDHEAFVSLMGLAFEARHGLLKRADDDRESAERYCLMSEQWGQNHPGSHNPLGFDRILNGALFVVDNHFDLIQATAVGYLLGLPSKLKGGILGTPVSAGAASLTHFLVKPSVPKFDVLFESKEKTLPITALHDQVGAPICTRWQPA
jgi:hypothetical protein